MYDAVQLDYADFGQPRKKVDVCVFVCSKRFCIAAESQLGQTLENFHPLLSSPLLYFFLAPEYFSRACLPACAFVCVLK